MAKRAEISLLALARPAGADLMGTPIWGLRMRANSITRRGCINIAPHFIPRSYNGSTPLKREKVRGERSSQAAERMVWWFDSIPWFQFSVDILAVATVARCVQRSSTLQARWFDS